MKISLRILALQFLAACCVVPGGPTLLSQERPPDNATAAQIEDGLEKVRSGKWLDAIEQFQKVIDTAGDELVPVDRNHHAPARLVVQGHLANMGAEGVAIYRRRVDGQATTRLLEAKKARDDMALRRLVTDMFAAKPTEGAILELGQRAFLRGEFDAAEHYWRMLLPVIEHDERILRYPDPETSAAEVQARLLLVQLFRGERVEVQAALKEYRAKHADASGTLAGKTGKYVDTLMHLLNTPNETTLAKPPEQAGWPTFAGSPSRLGNTRMRLPYFWPDVPAWKSPLPFLRGGRFDSPPPDGTHPRSLAFHPVVADGRAYLADGVRVLSVDLMSGKVSGAAWPKGGEDTRIPTRQDIRHTLTEHDGILYARFGPSALKGGEGAEAKSFIAAFGPRSAKRGWWLRTFGERRETLWQLDPPLLADAMTHFEGAPLIHNDRLYVGLWRQSAGDAIAGMACYRIDDLKTAPELVWQKWVGKAGSEPNGETRFRHALLSISGPNVVYCTDGGTVVALNANDGKTAWEYRYPRNERPTLPRYRDLCPPLCDGGRIYAAPADTDRLLCLDAFTGKLIWDRDGIEVVHLLGVSQGRLIATIAGQVKGIRGFNLRTGADSGANGWTIHDDGGEATFGRGLVTEEAIVWPTKHGLHFLNPADGSPLRSPIRGSFGNLCYADGVLLVTTATEIWGYVSEAKKLSDRRKAIEKEPENPTLQADLCQSLIDAGQYAEAEKAAAKAGEAKERLLWLLAERVIREGDKTEARRIYEGLANGDGSFAAAGAVRIAESLDEGGKVRAKWHDTWPSRGDELDKQMLKVREAWLEVRKKNGTIRDHAGVPYTARSFANDFAAVSLEMRSGIFSPSPAQPSFSPQTMLPFSRLASSNWNEPILKLLACTNDGFVAQGERLYIDGREIALPTPSRFAAAEFVREDKTYSEPAAWVISGQSELIAIDPEAARVKWHIDLSRSTPLLSKLEARILPSASGHEEVPAFELIRDSRYGPSFKLGQTKQISMNGHRADGYDVDSAPSNSKASVLSVAYSDDAYSLVQFSNGRMVSRFGGLKQIVHEVQCTTRPWPVPPVPIRSSSGPTFLIPDDASVFLFDAKAAKELARYAIPDVASLSGELPQFRIHQGNPLLIIHRNHGIELDRLKTDGLKRAWKRDPIFVGRELDDLALSGEQFFTAADGTLTAYSWKDGERQWEIPLPEAVDTKWKITPSPQGLLVHPAEAIRTKTDFDAIGEFRKAGWRWDKLLQTVGKSYDVWTARELPILLIDPADGRLIQRLNFPALGPAAGVAVTPKGVVVVTGKGSWTLNSK